MFALAVSLREYSVGPRSLGNVQVTAGALRVIDLHENRTFMTTTDSGRAFGWCEAGRRTWAAMTPTETL